MFIPAVAADRALALAKIAAAFNHIYTASNCSTFCTGVLFCLITPIVGPATYSTVTCIGGGHNFLLSVAD
jgi:hypothetical protein